MLEQLIVTVLGKDQSGILSEIATTASETECNILDSRQAIYGEDFSLTMILEGKTESIVRAECLLPRVCQHHNLLSIMKRTQQHAKQNLVRLFDLEFSGKDAAGLISKVTNLLAKYDVSISAFRQKTYKHQDQESMRCKLVINVPNDCNVSELKTTLDEMFEQLELTATLKDTHHKDDNENTTSWR